MILPPLYIPAKPKESELKPSPPKTGLTFGIGQLSATKTIGGPSSTTPFTGFGFNPTPVTVAPGSGFSFAVGTSKPTTSSEAAGTCMYIIYSLLKNFHGLLYNLMHKIEIGELLEIDFVACEKKKYPL